MDPPFTRDDCLQVTYRTVVHFNHRIYKLKALSKYCSVLG